MDMHKFGNNICVYCRSMGALAYIGLLVVGPTKLYCISSIIRLHLMWLIIRVYTHFMTLRRRATME